ncbi:LCP family protein [Humibacter sp.]|jgi:LCP family protein required for cell wall assembly|uniref:LCP family protein n=1 Tax=Humibacter sp. TaxID=1940291 RepID=UPI002CF5C379|nr:LCP family protein [Humibacter sp.]HVX08987.1 LCP family protein [Humibacter sp.]
MAERQAPGHGTRHTRAAARAERAPSGIARHGRLRRHPWATFGKVVASVVAVAVVSTLGIAGVAAVNLVSDTKKSFHLSGEAKQAIPNIAELKGGVNILVAATDTRSGQGDSWGTLDDSEGAGNNDVTMLLHLSKDHTHAIVVSFPRDLMVPIPQCGDNDAQDQAQFNTTLSEGGMSCVADTVTQLTGVKIPFAALITFEGVVAMSNAVGGVPVCIGGDGIDDPDTSLNLPPGNVTLQGQDAAEFLRTRHGLEDGSDLARISNQQVFLSSLVRTIMSNGTLSNPVKVWGLAKATTSNVTLSDSLNNVTTLYQIAMALKGLNWNNIAFVQYPTVEDPDDTNRVIPDDDAAQTLDNAIINDQYVQITGGTGGSVTASDQPAQQPPAASSPSPSDKKGSGKKSTATATPSPTSTPVQLSDNVHGQTAATQTCSNGAG